jgi:magnesium transporter
MRGGTQAQDGGDGMTAATTTDGTGLAAHLATNVPVVPSDASVPEVLAALAGRRFATAAAVAVCDDGRLVGLVRLEDLFAAARDATAAELVDRDAVVVVAATIDREVAVQRAVRRGRDTLAVVDAAGRFLGLVPPSEVLAVLTAEHDEDLARLSGFTHDVAAARHASVESVGRRFRHRLPWLLLGLAGAVASADLVGSFEGQLERNVILAFFIPGIVYMADAVGTQTETLVVRGLSIGVGIGQVAVRELLTGLLVGITLAAAFLPVGLWRWGEPDVVLAVALSLLAACSIATLIAMALPWLLHRLGRDPAYGSGPLATVLQDLLSVLIYMVIAGILVH